MDLCDHAGPARRQRPLPLSGHADLSDRRRHGGHGHPQVPARHRAGWGDRQPESRSLSVVTCPSAATTDSTTTSNPTGFVDNEKMMAFVSNRRLHLPCPACPLTPAYPFTEL